MRNFTNLQYSVLIGLLLSDGTLVKRNPGLKAGASFGLTQTSDKCAKYVEAHVELLIYVFELFKEFCNYTEPKIGYAKSKTSAKTYQYMYFATAINSLFTELYHIWYIAGIKTVPANIASLLDPVALAFWAMGDGGKCGKGFHLNTVAFSPSCTKLLVDALKSNFDLNCTIHSRNRIYISSKEFKKFKQIVAPHFLNKFNYKLEV